MKLVYESIDSDGKVMCAIYKTENGRYEATVGEWKGTADSFNSVMDMAEKHLAARPVVINVYLIGEPRRSLNSEPLGKQFEYVLYRFLKKRKIKEYRTQWIHLPGAGRELFVNDGEYAIVMQRHTPPIRIRGKNPELVVVVTY
jgi:hypothetical protein